jgi:hypothetical protein
MLLWNRIFWLGLGLSAFAVAVATFDPSRQRVSASSPTSPVTDAQTAPRLAPVTRVSSPQRTTSWHTLRVQFLWETWREVFGILGGLPFLAMLLLGLIVLIETAGDAGNIFDMPVYPRTHLMVEALQGGYAKVLLLVAVLFSGEIIWRDRALEMHEAVDTLPTPTGIFVGAKLVALLLVIGVFQLTGVLALIVYQLLQGYTHLELSLYARGILIAATYPALMVALSCALHVASRNRIAGYGLAVLFIVIWDVLEEFGFEHHLYRYASLPPTPYSDLNGYGHFLEAFGWLALYWAWIAIVLVGVSAAFWRRGTDDSWRARWREARLRFRGPLRSITMTAMCGAFATGAWIFYNTNVRNVYVSSTTLAAQRALYEQRYGQYQHANLPRVVSVHGHVDIYPSDRRVGIRSTYRLQNRSPQPQRDIHVSIPAGVRLLRLDLAAHSVVYADDALGYHILRLRTPLAPSDSLELGFELAVENNGFVNNGASVTVVENGSYFTKRDFFPVIGFDPQRLLMDPDERKEQGLAPLPPLADPGDRTARNRSPRASDADRVEFDVTVSTDLDQTAITSGELLRSWTANNRRYAQYRANVPITHHFGFVSARYTLLSSLWKGIAIEIYHHPAHRENTSRMMHAARQSLAYYTENFGPYPHRSLRLVEIPRYTRDATSLPGFISFSESMGFNARLGSDTAIDYPFYVTAHEIAHQWWGHQLVGANSQGTGTLHETLAQYSALMVMEREVGRSAMPQVLNYEREWYLRGRGGERGAEPSLARVAREEYVYYHKGALAMYALRDMVGEAPLNRALSRLLTQFASAPPYATSDDLLYAIQSVVPTESTNDFTESFTRVVMTEAGLTEPVVIRQSSGRYELGVTFTMRKTRMDSSGVEKPSPLDTWVELAIYDDSTAPPTIERRRITASPTSWQFIRDRRPVRVVLDPFHKLLERNREDNEYRLPAVKAADAALLSPAQNGFPDK